MKDSQAGTSPAVPAEVHERLVREFSELLDASDVAACVARARRELDAVPTGALPELLERLARVRLQGQLDVAASA